MKEYDVAIIGASVSGGSLAACLGRKGLSVAVIDRGRFPRRKACGEGLSNVAISAMSRMGLDVGPAIESGIPYFGYRIDLGKRSFAFASDRGDSLRGVGVQRLHLDRLILDSATACPSVSTFLGIEPVGFRKTNRNFMLKLSDGHSLSARQLVLADGANSRNASLLGIPVRRKPRPLWGISYIMEGFYREPPGEVRVILKDGFEINCTPVSPQLLNLTFLVEKSWVKPLQEAGYVNQLLAEAMRPCHFAGRPSAPPLQVGPVNAARRPYTHDSIMLLGDAAENLDPVAGMGMTHGVLMAEIAAECLVSRFQKQVSAQEAHSRYAHMAGKMGKTYRGFTRLTSSLLRNPARALLLPVISSTVLPSLFRRSLDGNAERCEWLASMPRHLLHLVGA